MSGNSMGDSTIFLSAAGPEQMMHSYRFDTEIKNVVDQIIVLYKPKKIILFGSLARNNLKAGNDIDLFIIKEDVPHLGVDRIRQLDRLIKYKLATDFIVYTPAEVEQRIEVGDPFVKSILNEGKVLYDAG